MSDPESLSARKRRRGIRADRHSIPCAIPRESGRPQIQSLATMKSPILDGPHAPRRRSWFLIRLVGVLVDAVRRMVDVRGRA